MKYAEVTLPRRVLAFRLIGVALVLAALAAAVFASAPADAQSQGTSVNPRAVHQRVDADGDELDGFYWDADETAANYIRFSIKSDASGQRDVAPTYLDFGVLEVFFVTSGTNTLHPGTQVRDWWFAADGMTALTACSDDSGGRCRITKTDYQALAGQVGAEDSEVIKPIRIAFKVPNSMTRTTMVLQTKHVVWAATRRGTDTWRSSAWTEVDKHAPSATSLNASGGTIGDEYVFSNADGNLGGNLVHARIAIGGSHIPGFSSPNYDRWGGAANSGIQISIHSGSGLTVNRIDNQVNNAFFKADGTTPLGCSSLATNACFLDKALWKGLAGQSGVTAEQEATTPIMPIRIAFKVPSEDSNGNAFNADNKVTLRLLRWGLNDDGSTYVRTIDTEYTRIVAHVVRRQSASRVGNTRTALDPGDPLPAAGATHSTWWCEPGDTGDCDRDLEVGESMYIATALTRGVKSALAAGRFQRSAIDWLNYGPDYFDEFELSFTPAQTGGGDAVVAIGSLCPIEIPGAGPEHPFVDAPRDRTAAALRVCKYNRDYYVSGYYNSVANPDGVAFWDTGTGPFVFGTKAGDGTITVKYLLGDVVVGQADYDITIGAAVQANLLSDSAAPMITAGLGQRDAGGPLALQIGYERARGIPAYWPDMHELGGPGYFGPARYEQVESVALTVPAGGGTLEVLGTFRSCTAGSDACTITLSRGDLKQAARYGYTPTANDGAIADTDAIFPSRLLLHGAASRDVTISGTLTLVSGTPDTFNFNYTAKAALNAAGATVAAYLPGDSDGILAPGQSAGVAVGYQVPDWIEEPESGNGAFRDKFKYDGLDPTMPEIDASALLTSYADEAGDTSAIQVLQARQSDWVWTTYSPGETDFEIEPGAQIWLGAPPPPLTYRYSPVPAVWAVRDEGYMRTYAKPEPAHDVDYVQPGVMTGAYLQITGPATWTETGGKRLRLDYTDYTHVKCVDSSTLDANLAGGRTCYVVDADGNAPSITADRDASGDIKVTADLPLYVLIGAAPSDLGLSLAGDRFTRPLNTHSLRRTSAFGSGTLRVAAVSQLASISLGRKPVNNVVPTTPIRIGSTSSEIRLALRNENGQASQLSAVSAITLTVIGGGTLSGQGCSNASSCTISTSSGDLFDAAKANPAVVAAIDLTYNAPTRPGEASIRATVVGNDGSTFTETVDLTISGSARELAVGGTMPRVHSSATDNDDRDKILIPITAQDGNGNPAPMPRNAAVTVSRVGGAALPAGSHTATVKCEDEADPPRLKCNIEIVVTASASQPLASGAYTATVTGAGIGSTEAGFAVGGPADALSISIPDTLPGLAQGFTATVRVVDAAGVPVADGTWVAFSTTATGGGSPSAVVTSPGADNVDHDNDADTPMVSQRRAATKNGEVSANVTVVGNGVAVLMASTGFGASLKSASEALNTLAAALPADATGAVGQVLEYSTSDGEPDTSAWATYLGTARTTADELLGHAESPDGARVVWLWNGVEWIHYGETADGDPIPRSRSFFVLPTDTVWFGE